MKFWKRTAERALKTAAQSALAVAAAKAGLDVRDLDWIKVGGIAAMAAVLSVLSSIASSEIGDEDDPSLVP